MNQHTTELVDPSYLKCWTICFSLSLLAWYISHAVIGISFIWCLWKLDWLIPHAGIYARFVAFAFSASASFFIFRWSTKRFLLRA